MFKLPILGAGTGSVEALSSYLHRCANAHTVSTSAYLNYLLRNSSKYNLCRRNSTRFVPSDLNIYSRSVICAFKEEMNVDATASAFESPFTGLTVNYDVTVSRTMRWCPECYREALDSGSEPYVKLIWHLSDITHCNHHATPLLKRCTSCSKFQCRAGRMGPIYICWHCHEPLTARDSEKTFDLLFSWNAQCPDLIKFFSDISVHAGLFDPVYGIEKSINDFTARCLNDEFYEAFRYCWSRREIRDTLWQGCFHPYLKIDTLRNICRLCNIDIFDFVSGNILNVSRQLPWPRSIPHPFASPCKAALATHTSNYKKLVNLMHHLPRISLEEVAAKIDLDILYLKNRFPSVCSSITTNYEAHLRDSEILEMNQKSLGLLDQNVNRNISIEGGQY